MLEIKEAKHNCKTKGNKLKIRRRPCQHWEGNQETRWELGTRIGKKKIEGEFPSNLGTLTKDGGLKSTHQQAGSKKKGKQAGAERWDFPRNHIKQRNIAS